MSKYRIQWNFLDFALMVAGLSLFMFVFRPYGESATASRPPATEHLGLVVAWVVVGTVIVLAWLAISWWLSGRDPSAGAIAPHWEPPEDITPAEAHFLDSLIRRKVPDTHRAFTATLLSLAVRGYIAMHRVAGQPVLERIGQMDDALLFDEKRLLNKLFEKKDYVSLSEESSGVIRQAKEEMFHVLSSRIENIYIDKNRFSFYAILAFALLTEIGLLFFDIRYAEAMGRKLFALHVLFMLAAAGLAFYASQITKYIMNAMGRTATSEFHIILVSILVFTALFMLNIYTTAKVGNIPSIWYLALFLGMVVIPSAVVAAWYVLPRPSVRARRLLDRLEGLRMFIRGTERKYLNRAPAPGTPDEQAMSESWYRELLPWAIALGVERQWTNAFRGWLFSVETGLGAERLQAGLPEIDFGRATGGPAPRQAAGQDANGHWPNPEEAGTVVRGDGT